MDINKVDLLLKYILTAAGQEDSGHREVGPIHLVKYVYLADLAFAEGHGEKLLQALSDGSFTIIFYSTPFSA